MTLWPRHYVRFLDGRAGREAVVAFLPLDLGAHMPTTCSEVKITHEYAVKMQRKHRLVYEDFLLIQSAIDRGYCIKAKDRHLEFFYIHEEQRAKHYIIVLKAAASGRETWVATFHRTKEEQLRSRLRRFEQVRTHVW